MNGRRLSSAKAAARRRNLTIGSPLLAS